MYRFVLALNNNVALAKDEQDNEVILLGNGIGFNKREGEVIKAEDINKIFYPFSP